jgi:hypothetical protein
MEQDGRRMKEFVGFVLIIVLIGCTIYACFSVWDFIIETPKQLKRIADALERRDRYGN